MAKQIIEVEIEVPDGMAFERMAKLEESAALNAWVVDRKGKALPNDAMGGSRIVLTPIKPPALKLAERVNALAGVDDPAEFITRLKARVAELEKGLSDLLNIGHVSQRYENECSCSVHENARKLLSQPEGKQ